MNTWCCVLLAACHLAVFVHGRFDGDLYGEPSADMLLQELEKRLADMRAPDASAYYQDSYFPYYDGDLSAETRDDSTMQEDIREPEQMSHGSQSQGFQYISGGAGEGKQELKPEGDLENMQEVKSDEGLPFYCHPPNPCPKGFTAAKDGCHDFIQDTVDEQQTWISKMMEKGICTCDKEHMFSCPNSEKGEPDGGDQQGPGDQSEMDNILDYMQWQANNKDEGSKGGWEDGEKLHVVAKKAPIVKRSVVNEAAIDAELERMKKSDDWHHNPYMKGGKVATYAKKG